MTATRPQVRDEVVEYVQTLILTGEVAASQLLRLAPIAEALGASITPVREGLLALTQDGWLQQEPNRGFRVLPIRRRDMLDVYMVHAYVAGELAARAAANATAQDVAELAALNERIHVLTRSEATSRQDVALEVDIVNSQIHKLIDDLAASPRLASFRQVALRLVPRRQWAMVAGWSEFNDAGHNAIVEAFQRRDPDSARAAMRRHIEEAGQLLVRHLDSVSFWAEDRE